MNKFFAVNICVLPDFENKLVDSESCISNMVSYVYPMTKFWSH